jgi:hypothetical protein
VGVVELDRETLAELARAWVRRTCEEQGVPAKVTDPGVLGRVADLLVTATEELRASTRGTRERGRSG